MTKGALILLALALLGLSNASLANSNRLSCRLSWGEVEPRHVCYLERDLLSIPPFSLFLGFDGVYTGRDFSFSPYLGLHLNLKDLWIMFEVGVSLSPVNRHGIRHAVSFGKTW